MTDRFRAQLTPQQFAAIEARHLLGIGRPRDVANGIAFLLADTGAWITGSALVIDGGYTAH
jgi:NAD(P)-dependent dehydrogenase (short-subunit alcohol dehydrogenase family)